MTSFSDIEQLALHEAHLWKKGHKEGERCGCPNLLAGFSKAQQGEKEAEQSLVVWPEWRKQNAEFEETKAARIYRQNPQSRKL